MQPGALGGVTIIADDLTGACDAGCLFAGEGPVGVVAEPALTESDRPVVAVDTETRALPPADAARRIRAFAQRADGRLRAGRVFKKVDSTMRGSVGAELSALLDGARSGSALLCPAFPAQGRTVVHGRLLVDGVPAHESPVGRDPAYPAATSELTALLARHGGAPLATLSLDEVRAGREKIAHALEQHPGHIVAADAETDADLMSLAQAAVSMPSTLAAGSAGLGRAVAEVLGRAAAPARLPSGSAQLIVVGSLHPASRAQLDALAAAGVPGVRVDARGHSDLQSAVMALRNRRPAFIASGGDPEGSSDARRRLAVAQRLARAAQAVLERAGVDLLVVTGGETAHALVQALQPERLDLVGAPASGLALGRLVMRGGPAVPFLTKAGGFGGPDLVRAILRGAL